MDQGMSAHVLSSHFTNAERHDRILYHIGNSTFHKHMFNLPIVSQRGGPA